MSQDDRRPGEGHYVYCIAETSAISEPPGAAPPSPIEEGTSLEFVSCGDLTAVSSPVPLSIYGEEVLSERLSDATWTAVRAMRHEHVVEHFAKRTSVVPLRFGTIYLERSGVVQMLDSKAPELKAIIEKVRDREEWGINVFSDRTKLIDGIISRSPRLRQLSAEADRATPGQAYLLKKKIEGLRVDEARKELARIIDEIESHLIREAVDSKRLRILKVESTESGEVKAKFAFLVARSAFDRFRAVAERLASETRDVGVRLELTGPWPVYNFAE